MVNAKELRIGNSVERRGEIGTVYSINPQDIWVKFGAEYGDTELWRYADVEPIPLTPDILEKCGFTHGRHRMAGDTWSIPIFKSASRNLSLTKMTPTTFVALIIGDGEEAVLNHLYYLHELQNLVFALTNTELTVIL